MVCVRGLLHKWLRVVNCMHMLGEGAEGAALWVATTSLDDMKLLAAGGATDSTPAQMHTQADPTHNMFFKPF